MECIEVTYRGQRHRVHHHERIPLSTMLKFGNNPTNIYGVAPASTAPLRYGDSLASVEHGGACNASLISLVPHCHGTHTECVGHIMPGEHNVAKLVFEPFIAATLIRVPLRRAGEMSETYNASARRTDLIITRAAIDDALSQVAPHYLQALVIAAKAPSWRLADEIPPYFSHQAMARIVELGVHHLLVDVPSIDRLHDGGRMDNHRCFWGMGLPAAEARTRLRCSVTEMAQVSPATPVGSYFLSLHLPDCSGDALPSKPILFPFSRGNDAA